MADKTIQKMTNGLRRPRIRVPAEIMTKTNRTETLNLVNSILHHLNPNTLKMMANKLTAVRIESKALLEDVAELIHQKALSRPNMIGEYAELCAIMTADQSFNRPLRRADVTLLQVLLPKCYDLLYTCTRPESNETAPPQTFSAEHYARLLANSTFIAQLYNRGVLSASVLWSFVMHLARKNSNAQIHCLVTILRTAGSRLSKVYSLSRIVGHVLLLENEAHREEVMCAALRTLIQSVKVQHAKYWLHEEPDRVVKGNMRCVNADLVKTNKTASVKKEYALCLMTECALEDCRDLISKYANGKNAKKNATEHVESNLTVSFEAPVQEANDVTRMLSPGLGALLATDQTGFVVHLTAAAVNATCPRIGTDAAELAADLVTAGRLAKYVAYTEFENMCGDDHGEFASALSEFEFAFTRRLNDGV